MYYIVSGSDGYGPCAATMKPSHDLRRVPKHVFRAVVDDQQYQKISKYAELFLPCDDQGRKE